jgi:dTDP-4-dehydrorhamnose reductase
MTEKPFVHKKAYANVKTSFIFHEDVVRILFKLLNEKGIINLGGKSEYIYNFAKKFNSNVKKIYLKKSINNIMPFNSTINLQKLNNILKKK